MSQNLMAQNPGQRTLPPVGGTKRTINGIQTAREKHDVAIRAGECAGHRCAPIIVDRQLETLNVPNLTSNCVEIKRKIFDDVS